MGSTKLLITGATGYMYVSQPAIDVSWLLTALQRRVGALNAARVV